MELIELGNSGLKVTPIGLGLAALGRPGYINLGHAQDLDENYNVAAMEANAHAVLDAAWDAGIRYFDAARSYGRAEMFLSTWLSKHQFSTTELTVGSKWGYTYTADWHVEAEHHEIKDHSLPVLKRQWLESKSLLEPYLDLYQIHSATIDSGVLQNQEVLTELARLRAEDLKIGLSLSGTHQAETLRRAMEIRYDGGYLFSAVQSTWNVLAQEAGEVLAAASQEGWGIIIKEALANGRLTSRNQEPDFQYKKSLLEESAAKWQISIDALAIAVVLNQPWVDMVLSGAATVEHLNSNVTAVGINLQEELVGLLAELREAPQQYWTKRSELAWN